VVFNVGGQNFEILRQTILARPDTLLATMLDDIATDSSKAMFIDANPERFAHILDWYRCGEMYLTSPLEAIFKDARFFLLPDAIKINGTSHVIRQATNAKTVQDATMSAIRERWPSFDQYANTLVAQTLEHFKSLAEDSSKPSVEAPSLKDDQMRACTSRTVLERAFPKKKFILRQKNLWSKEYAWTDESNVCNMQRLWVLLSELEGRGFICELLDTGLALALHVSFCSSALVDGKLEADHAFIEEVTR
jgi:hypothetical protein